MRAIALLVVLGLSGCLAAPADLQKLEALKEKLRSLHDVLDELNKNIDSLESQQDEKREFVSTPAPVEKPDAELQDFLNHLSPEDEALVEKMKSKLAFLQATVHEEPGVDIPAKDGYAEEQPAETPAEEKRGMEPELKNMYDHMNEEDKALLREHPSAWSHLSKALKTQGGNAADAVAQADDKRELVNQLSEEDQELLRRMRSKLGNLKTALRSQKSPVDEVQQRLLNDVRYAKENGVSLKDVLRTLIEAKNKA